MQALLALLMMAIPKRGVIVLGQSLALGLVSPAYSTTAVADTCWWSDNAPLQFIDGFWRVTSGRTPSDCAPAVEATYESPRVAMASAYHARTGESLMLMSAAVGAHQYTWLKKGTAPWNVGIYQMESYGARVTGATILGGVVIHGESDNMAGMSAATYCAALLEWQADLQDLVRRVTFTGRDAVVPLYVSQLSKFTGTGTTAGYVAMGQYNCAKANPGRIVLVGPKYQFPYGDALHVTAAGSRDMALLNGDVLASGGSWAPLWPESVTLSGNVVRACFHVPYPPMVVDTTIVASTSNRGLQYTCGSSPPPISSVALFGTDCVDVTLDSEPSPACQLDDVLRYGWDSGVSQRGNLRDSHPNGAPFYSWAVHFEEPVQ